MQYLPASDTSRRYHCRLGVLAQQFWLARMEWMGSRTQSGLEGCEGANRKAQLAGKHWMRPWRMVFTVGTAQQVGGSGPPRYLPR